jgi:hypothetical protein
VDLLASGRPIRGTSVQTVSHSEQVSALASRARELAPEQRAHDVLDVTCATPDLSHAAPNVARVANRFPRTSHVHRPDLLLKYSDATVATYKRR